MDKIAEAKEKFGKILEEQLKRVERMNSTKDPIDFDKLDKIIIGVAGGDGIGPAITEQGSRIMEYLLADEIAKGKVEIRKIDGLTIENRAAAGKAIPDDVLAEIKNATLFLKAQQQHLKKATHGQTLKVPML